MADEIDKALARVAAGQPAKPNDGHYLAKAAKEGSQRGRNYQQFLAGNRKTPT